MGGGQNLPILRRHSLWMVPKVIVSSSITSTALGALGIMYCTNSKEPAAQIKQSSMAYELSFCLGTLIVYIRFQVTIFLFKVSIILIP